MKSKDPRLELLTAWLAIFESRIWHLDPPLRQRATDQVRPTTCKRMRFKPRKDGINTYARKELAGLVHLE